MIRLLVYHSYYGVCNREPREVALKFRHKMNGNYSVITNFHTPE